MRVYFLTHGCKANQYDTERFRQELQARGATVVERIEEADACVVNTCTVTNNADADARKAIRRAKRDNPEIEIIVAGCSAALHFDKYLRMKEVSGVVKGHDAIQVAGEVENALRDKIAPLSPFLDHHDEPIGAALLQKDEARTRGWLKIQDGCDRRCSFCATRLARGDSRSRHPDEIIAEAQQLANYHRELVFTGIHIGHYGRDLNERGQQTYSLSRLVARLVEEVPYVRFRLGSIEATEVDDLLVELLLRGDNRVVPHLHVPMQSGSNSVLRRMRRWHTREQYRDRLLEIADGLPYLGLGADIIVGFPGETEQEFEDTRDLVESLPYTYLHVFPYSVRDNTPAADLPDKVPGNISAARSQVLRDLVVEKGLRYQEQRSGQAAEIVVETGEIGLTEDYLRVELRGDYKERLGDIVYAPLKYDDGRLFVGAG